jgi:thiol-disulfide isomerase/thioredoxin
MKPCAFLQCTNRIVSAALLTLTVQLGVMRLFAADADSATNAPTAGDADLLWRELRNARRPPGMPASWRTNTPSAEDLKAFDDQKKELIAAAIAKAKDFQRLFPTDSRVAAAGEIEASLTRIAEQLADTARREAVAASAIRRASEANDPAEREFQKKFREMQRQAYAKEAEGQPAVLAEMERGTRELMKEYPKREELFSLLLSVASAKEGDEARKLVKEIADNPDAGAAAERAKGMLARFDALGKPVEIKFTAVDGRQVDLAAMKGKVVLIDFWATWCQPCVAELPNVKAAYEKLHPKGFEIVGISLDQDKDALVKFTAKQEMAWPQFFDGKGWGNELAQKHGINSIPTMWLVNKQGVLCDLEVRGNLEGKVEKLLAE